MLCKWCGADVPNSETKCPRCKRDMSAKSDCGGYYDIVSAPKAEPAMGFQPASKEIIRERIVPQKEKINWLQIGLAAAACVGLLFALVQLSGLSGKVDKAVDAANQNGQRTDQIIGELRRVRGDKEYRIDVSVEQGEKVKTTMELGNYNNDVASAVVLDEQTGDVREVQISMGQTKNAVVMEVDKTAEEGKTIIQANSAVSKEIFDEEKAVSYRWECKIGGIWVELSDEKYQEYVKISEEGDTITFEHKALTKLFEAVDTLQLRVICERTNVCDEKLEIQVAGITLEKPDVEENEEETDEETSDEEESEEDDKAVGKENQIKADAVTAEQ